LFWKTSHRIPVAIILSLFGWLVAGGWCWFVLREKYCWLVVGGWFVLREKYRWLVEAKRTGRGEKEEYRGPARPCNKGTPLDHKLQYSCV
jgi:hypothetical protein